MSEPPEAPAAQDPPPPTTHDSLPELEYVGAGEEGEASDQEVLRRGDAVQVAEEGGGAGLRGVVEPIEESNFQRGHLSIRFASGDVAFVACERLLKLAPSGDEAVDEDSHSRAQREGASSLEREEPSTWDHGGPSSLAREGPLRVEEPADDEEGSMPQPSAGSRSPPAQEDAHPTSAAEESGDDAEMPPLLPGPDGGEEMPPLLPGGLAEESDGDEDMPPLLPGGLAEESDGDEEMPPLLPGEEMPPLLPGGEESDDDEEMPPLLPGGPVEERPPLPPGGLAEESEDDEEMPPLLPGGLLPGRLAEEPEDGAPQPPGWAAEESEDDEEMPPLVSGGPASGAGAGDSQSEVTVVARGEEGASADDTPPVIAGVPRIGCGPASVAKEAPASAQMESEQQDEDDEDAMPPLVQMPLGAASGSDCEAPSPRADTAPPQRFDRGDRVAIRGGAEDPELRGLTGIVVNLQGGRVSVLLDPPRSRIADVGAAQLLRVARLDSESDRDIGRGLGGEEASGDSSDGSDDSMPPLHALGGRPPSEDAGSAAPPSGAGAASEALAVQVDSARDDAEAAGEEEEEENEEMPPLVQQGGSSSSTAGCAGRGEEHGRSRPDMGARPSLASRLGSRPATAAAGAAVRAFTGARLRGGAPGPDAPPPVRAFSHASVPERAAPERRPDAPPAFAWKRRAKTSQPAPAEAPPEKPARRFAWKRGQATAPPAPEPPAVESGGFDPGHRVRLRGLSKLQLNGQLGSVVADAGASDGRVLVELHDLGQRMRVRLENVEAAPEASDSDGSMPPLAEWAAEAAGVAADGVAVGHRASAAEAPRGRDVVAEAPRGRDAEAPRGADSEVARGGDAEAARSREVAAEAGGGREAPAARGREAEAVGGREVAAQAEEARGRRVEAPGAAPDPTAEEAPERREVPDFRAGELVVLSGLRSHDLNGFQCRVVRLRPELGRGDRVELRLVGSGKLLIASASNLRRCSDAAAPPAEGRGRPERRPVAPALAPGELVVLRGLARAEFNGQCGEVVQRADAAAKGKVAVRLRRSGQLLAVPRARLERVDPDTSSDDSVPPLLCVGAGAAAAGDCVPQLPRRFSVGERVVLRGLRSRDYEGREAVVLPSNPTKVLAGQVMVQLATGRRLVLDEKHVVPQEPPPDAQRDAPQRKEEAAPKSRSSRRKPRSRSAKAAS